jgi:hypothetical protein
LLLLNRKMCLPGCGAQLQAKNSGKKLSLLPLTLLVVRTVRHLYILGKGYILQ